MGYCMNNYVEVISFESIWICNFEFMEQEMKFFIVVSVDSFFMRFINISNC